MLAYISWHQPATARQPGAGARRDRSYEQALEHFHRSLAHVPPSGLRGSTVAWIPHLPWEAPDHALEHGLHAGCRPEYGAYEDWYLLDGWSSVGVLEEAAVSRGHLGAHEAVAALGGPLQASIYRLLEGHAQLAGSSCIWVGPSAGGAPADSARVTRDSKPEPPSLAALLGDGMEPASDGLWRRCLALGPAPEYCLARTAGAENAGVAADRLPSGWKASRVPREVLFDG